MKMVFSAMTACSILLCSISAVTADEDGTSVAETDEDAYSFTETRNDRGMYLVVTPRDQDDENLGIRLPADCPECGTDCLMPALFSFSGSENEYAGGVVSLSSESPARCIRFDGVHVAKDKSILLIVENREEKSFRIEILESGEPLLERDLQPGESLEEELMPVGDRRYSIGISANPSIAEVSQTEVGFAIYRYEYPDLVMSLVQIGLGGD